MPGFDGGEPPLHSPAHEFWGKCLQVEAGSLEERAFDQRFRRRLPTGRPVGERRQRSQGNEPTRSAADELRAGLRIEFDRGQRVDPASEPSGQQLETRLGLEPQPQHPPGTGRLTAWPDQEK